MPVALPPYWDAYNLFSLDKDAVVASPLDGDAPLEGHDVRRRPPFYYFSYEP